MYLGVDYMLRSDSAYPAFKEKGVGFVCRYLCPPKWPKLLTNEEARVLSDAGFNIVSVWEDNSVRASWFTWDRGVREGLGAVAAAEKAGQPAGTAIYFAVDYDAQPGDMAAIATYMDAVEAQLQGYVLGVYGGYKVIDYFANRGVKYLWQTYAWSGGKVHPKAQLYQYHNGINIGGVATDLNKCFADPGWWRIGGVLTPKEYEEAKEEKTVPLLRLNDKGSAVSVLQALLNAVGYQCPVDGAFSPATLEAVKAFQRASSLAVDGIVGPLTWGALTKAQPKGTFALLKLARIKEIMEEKA